MSPLENEQILIDRKESQELKKGEIERVRDEGINTIADLTEFLKEQRKQATDILIRKAIELFSEGYELSSEEKEILDASIQYLDTIIDSAIDDLTIASVQVACSQLSDIVGFDLEIDGDAIDQFGLTKRYTVQETHRSSRGFIGYKEEKMEDGYVRVQGKLEAEARRLAMAQFDVKKRDIDTTLMALRKYGTAEYTEISTAGPILVLLPELHYDAGILRDNFDALIELKTLISVLGTEGIEGELTQSNIGIEKGSSEVYKEKISQYKVAVSSVAVEGVLGNLVYTLGVDSIPAVSYLLKKLQAEMANISREPVKMQKILQYVESLIFKEDLKKIDIVNLHEDIAEIITGEVLLNLLVAYRNQLWLHSLQRSFLEEKGKHSSKSNIAFMVCGAAHIKDLAAQAAHFGFKGVIIFNPRSFEEKLDYQTLETYMSQQLGDSKELPQKVDTIPAAKPESPAGELSFSPESKWQANIADSRKRRIK